MPTVRRKRNDSLTPLTYGTVSRQVRATETTTIKGVGTIRRLSANISEEQRAYLQEHSVAYVDGHRVFDQRVLRTTSSLLEEYRLNELSVKLNRAIMKNAVMECRGTPIINRTSGVLLNVSAGGDYFMTPEPMQRKDWLLAAAMYKLALMKIRGTDLLSDDVLFMVCDAIDKCFYTDARSSFVVTVRDLAEGKDRMPPLLPGATVRTHLLYYD